MTPAVAGGAGLAVLVVAMVLECAGLVLAVRGLLVIMRWAWGDGLSPKDGYLLMAISGLVMTAASVLIGWRPLLALYAAVVLWFGWLWWNSGGGDDTRRLGKRLGERFRPVRRTAPSPM